MPTQPLIQQTEKLVITEYLQVQTRRFYHHFLPSRLPPEEKKNFALVSIEPISISKLVDENPSLFCFDQENDVRSWQLFTQRAWKQRLRIRTNAVPTSLGLPYCKQVILVPKHQWQVSAQVVSQACVQQIRSGNKDFMQGICVRTTDVVKEGRVYVGVLNNLVVLGCWPEQHVDTHNMSIAVGTY